MSKQPLLAATLLLVAFAAPQAFAEEAAPQTSCCSVPTLEAFPGDDVDGYSVPNYVFVYADLDNDGVLRGKELRRAKNRVIKMERDNRYYLN